MDVRRDTFSGQIDLETSMNKSRVSHGRTTGLENSRSNSILAGDHFTNSVNK